MRNDYTTRWLRSALLEKKQNQDSLSKIWGQNIYHVEVESTPNKSLALALWPVSNKVYIFEIKENQVHYKIGYHTTSKALTGIEVKLMETETKQINDTLRFVQNLLNTTIWKF